MKAIIAATLLVLLGSCGKNEAPDAVFDNYSKHISAAKNVTEVAFYQYVSKSSADAIVENIKKYTPELADFDFSLTVNGKELEMSKVNFNPAALKEDDFLLTMLRDGAKEIGAQEEVVIEGDIAKLIHTKSDYPEPSTNYTRTVEFVNENGWKIDNIQELRKSEDSKLQSYWSF